MGSTSSCYVDPANQELFCNRLLLPALRQSMSKYEATFLPLSYRSEIDRHTNDRGQYVPKPTIIHRRSFARFVTELNRLCDTRPDYKGFKDFFFVSFSYGCKVPYQLSTGYAGIKSLFNDFNFGVVQPENVYFDLATNFHSDIPGFTYIWKSSKLHNKHWSPVLSVIYPGTNLNSTPYRHDMFGQVENLGGFKYQSNQAVGLGQYSLFMSQAYMGFKTPFFSRTSDSRHSIDLNIDQLYNDGPKDSYVLDKVNRILGEIKEQNQSYHCRLEVRLQVSSMSSYIRNIDNINSALQNTGLIYCVKTVDLADFFKIRVNSLRLLLQKAHNEGTKRNSDRILYIYLTAYTLFSGFFSRPSDWSTSRPVLKHLWENVNHRSSVLFISRLVDYQQNIDTWTIPDCLSHEVILAAFNLETQKKITKVVEKNPYLNVAPTLPEVNLEQNQNSQEIVFKPYLPIPRPSTSAIIAITNIFGQKKIQNPTKDKLPYTLTIAVFEHLGSTDEAAKYLSNFGVMKFG